MLFKISVSVWNNTWWKRNDVKTDGDWLVLKYYCTFKFVFKMENKSNTTQSGQF